MVYGLTGKSFLSLFIYEISQVRQAEGPNFAFAILSDKGLTLSVPYSKNHQFTTILAACPISYFVVLNIIPLVPFCVILQGQMPHSLS